VSVQFNYELDLTSKHLQNCVTWTALEYLVSKSSSQFQCFSILLHSTLKKSYLGWWGEDEFFAALEFNGGDEIWNLEQGIF